jgi:TRAP-type uncharacterized transport system substrate-binding protein
MRIATALSRISWRDVLTTAAPFLVAFAVVSLVTLHFLQPAPPTKLTISSGPDGSTFRRAAEKYEKILAHNGVTLKILPSDGSQENLNRLLDEHTKVDIAFVQGGLTGSLEPDRLISLGSLFYEPLYVFYRNPEPIRRLFELRGRRIAIGPDGSGTRALALTLLKANDIETADVSRLSALSGKAAASALLGRQIDAVFMMSDSSAPADVRALLHASDIRLFDVAQTDTYIRHFRYLSKLELGAGTFDLGENIPANPVRLLAPTVELLARPGLHPALSDLLIEAARSVHGQAGLLHHANEFPAPLEHEYSISDDALRFYKSGKTLSYRGMPFWLASLVDRILVVVVPALLVLIPALRLIPALYNWRIDRRIHRRYADLMALERVTLAKGTSEEREGLRQRLEEIDKAVINLKIPPSFANDAYVLREHIKFVRERLGAGAVAAGAA